MVKRSIEQNEEFWGQKWKFRNKRCSQESKGKTALTKKSRRLWGMEFNGQCSKGDNCSFRHDVNKRAKSTQPNPAPRSSTQQSVKNASRTRSRRGESPSGRMSRWPCKITSKELALIHSVSNGILRGACSTSQKMDTGLGKFSHAQRQVGEQRSKKFTKKSDKSVVSIWKSHDNWVSYSRTWSRRSLQRFYQSSKIEDWSQEETEWQDQGERSSVEAGEKCIQIKVEK